MVPSVPTKNATIFSSAGAKVNTLFLQLCIFKLLYNTSHVCLWLDPTVLSGRGEECVLYVGASVTSLSLKGWWLQQISKQLPQIEWSGWWMASGMMYGCCFLLTGLHRLCLVKWPPVPVRPRSPDLLSGCKYDPWYYMADAEWWASLSMGRKSDSPRFFLQPWSSHCLCWGNSRIQC